MRGLDTNVLVRYLVRDDKQQADAASALIGRMTAAGDGCFINLIVLCELVWVLESAYDLEKAAIASVLDKILATKQFEIEAKDVVRQAVQDYRLGTGDIADHLIGRINQAYGCKDTVTFDRSLKKSGAFTVLG